MSRTSTVPASVPSLDQSSRPVSRENAAKYARPWSSTNSPGDDPDPDVGVASMSFTSRAGPD
jgi:hypothetical protein